LYLLWKKKKTKQNKKRTRKKEIDKEINNRIERTTTLAQFITLITSNNVNFHAARTIGAIGGNGVNGDRA
jgi:hypothetical protein